MSEQGKSGRKRPRKKNAKQPSTPAAEPEIRQFNEPEEDRAPATLLVLLGTGTPIPDPEASGPALAIVRDEQVYLVDCGPGVVRRAAAARLPASALDRLFITHLHSDHTAGLADLMLTPWVVGRSSPLRIYGPPGTQAMVDHLLAAYAEDISIRVNGLERGDLRAVTPVVREYEPGEIYRDHQLSVRAFKVRHGTWPHAYGFRFETEDRVIAVSGDTRPFRGLERNYKGADILVHEAYCHAGFISRSKAWQKYHGAFHTSTLQLAKLAQAVKPGLLVLTHQLLFGETEQTMAGELESHYDGPSVYGRDLMVL